MIKIVNGIIPIIISAIISASTIIPSGTSMPFDEKNIAENSDILNDLESKEQFSELENGKYFAGSLEIKRSYNFSAKESGSYEFIVNGLKDISIELFDNDKNKKLIETKSNSKNSRTKIAYTLVEGKNYCLNINSAKSDMTRKSKDNYIILINRIEEPGDGEFNKQWTLLNKDNGVDINILPVWQYTKGKNIKIGIADTGMHFLHKDLDDNYDSKLSYNFIHDVKNVYPEDEADSGSAAKMGHGTVMAGIIGAELNNKNDGNGGIVGAAPECDIVSLKVMGSVIPDHPVKKSSVEAFINAVEYARENNIKIINCSLGGKLPSAAEKEAMSNAKDILFIISAGNNGEDLQESPMYPACYYNENSIVVASMDKDGNLWEYSNYGGPTDIMAPGIDIISTYPDDRYFENLAGTSISTPFVTAVCGLILSQDKDLSPADIKERVTGINNVTPVDGLKGKIKSMGYLNAYKAVLYPDIEDNVRKGHSLGGDVFSGDIKSQIKYYKNKSEKTDKTESVIVKFKPGVDKKKYLGQAGLGYALGKITQFSYVKLIDAYLLKFDSVEEADAAIDLLNSFDDIKYAEPDYLR